MHIENNLNLQAIKITILFPYFFTFSWLIDCFNFSLFPPSEGEEGVFRDQEKLDLVELLEAVTYLVCQDNHVIPDTFHKVRHIP